MKTNMEVHEYTTNEMKQMLAQLFVLQAENAKLSNETAESVKSLSEEIKNINKMIEARAKERAKELAKEAKWRAKMDLKSQKSDLKFERIMNKLASRQKHFDDLQVKIGGISKNNGMVAENFFIQGFEENMLVNGVKYNYLDPNKSRRIGNQRGEYDIVLVNSDRILIVEVKYRLRKNDIRDFYNNKLPKYKKLFPEHKDYTICGAVAALGFENNADIAAEKKGFLVFTQSGKNIKKLNRDDMLLSEF